MVFVSTLQQFKNIKFLTDFQVEEYYGAKGVDTWTLKTWEKEISNNDVCLFINLLIDCHKDTLGLLCFGEFYFH